MTTSTEQYTNKNNPLYDMLSEMRVHSEMDRIIQGEWLEGHWKRYIDGTPLKGCFFGCLMQEDSSDSIKMACEKYSLPLWLGRWAEDTFEGLHWEGAMDFPVAFLELAALSYEYITSSEFMIDYVSELCGVVLDDSLCHVLRRYLEGGYTLDQWQLYSHIYSVYDDHDTVCSVYNTMSSVMKVSSLRVFMDIFDKNDNHNSPSPKDQVGVVFTLMKDYLNTQ